MDDDDSDSGTHNKQTLHIPGRLWRINNKIIIIMVPPIKKLSKFSKQIWFVLLGLFILLIPLPVYLVASTPFIIHYILITRLIAPYFFKDSQFGKPVTSVGIPMSVEFMETWRQSQNQPRWSIVTCLVFEGTICIEEVKTQVHSNWIVAKNGGREALKYPEFQQYIDQWMGLMFWKYDKHFSLDNHVYSHDQGEDLDRLVEHLLVKPFVPRRSPWEIHVVQGIHDDKDSTALILRMHHIMADGFSIMSALVEGLFEIPSNKFIHATPAGMGRKSSSLTNRMISTLRLPYRVCRDLGYMINTVATQNRTLFHFPADKQKSNQIFGRSRLIPIQVVKDVKNCYGVSFTAVVLSSIGVGMGRILEAKGKVDKKKKHKIIFGTTLPLPGHPDKMSNHVTGTAIELLISSKTMDTTTTAERLAYTNNSLSEAKSNSTIPLILPFIAKLTSYHIAPVIRCFSSNTVLPAGLSNFPGPTGGQEWKGRRMLDGHFACGTGIGTQGMVFMILSYNGHIRITLTAEMEVLSREEVGALLEYIVEDVYYMYDNLHGKGSREEVDLHQHRKFCEDTNVV